MEKDDNTTEPASGPAKKLGLSKVVYGLGMSARDALAAFAVTTAALFPFMYAGQGKGGTIDKIAKVPDSIHSKWKEMFGEHAGKAGKALAVSAGLATAVSYVAHIPGLIKGPKKVRDAEATFNAEVEENNKQANEIKALTNTVKRQGMELTEAKARVAGYEEVLKGQAPSTARDSSAPAAGFAAQFTKEAGMSNEAKLLSQRAANENTAGQVV